MSNDEKFLKACQEIVQAKEEFDKATIKERRKKKEPFLYVPIAKQYHQTVYEKASPYIDDFSNRIYVSKDKWGIHLVFTGKLQWSNGHSCDALHNPFFIGDVATGDLDFDGYNKASISTFPYGVDYFTKDLAKMYLTTREDVLKHLVDAIEILSEPHIKIEGNPGETYNDVLKQKKLLYGMCGMAFKF